MSTPRTTRAARTSSHPISNLEHTVAESLDYLLPSCSLWSSPPPWPPDMFALTALLLLRTGAYRHATEKGWPRLDKWEAKIDRAGSAWRQNWNRGKSPPKVVASLWKTILDHKGLRLDSIYARADLCEALIQLCAISDAASSGIGLPLVGKGYDRFFEHAAFLLVTEGDAQLKVKGSTLCESVHSSRVRVLPKMHTPQTGLTVRSFSHHLALCRTDEMLADWLNVPSKTTERALNLLLVPWPYTISRGQFRASAEKLGHSGQFGYFEFSPRGARNEAAINLRQLLEKADDRGLAIDGIVFPELSLTFEQHRAVSEVALEHRCLLIAGVAMPAGETEMARNLVYVTIPLPGRNTFVSINQAKHHRWRLDRWQIERYGLGKILNPKKFWWERIAVEERHLAIIATTQWFTLSVLICEDLARSEPVGDSIRAVGPNLVVSLLLDGPQLPHRWSARYAMALADDPGSSVLTLTSLGMAQLGKQPSRAVGLWKDGQGGDIISIELPSRKSAAILQIDVQRSEEFTADGRSDGGAAGIPTLRLPLHFI